MRFFRQLAPALPVTLSNGAQVRFKTADGVRYYQAVTDPNVAAELERFMAQQRYGLTEVSAEEFKAEFLEKKTLSATLKPRWREEFGAGAVKAATPLAGVLNNKDLAAVVAVDKSDIRVESRAVADGAPPYIAHAQSTPTPAPAPAPAADFTPPVGRRVPAAKAA